MTKPSDGVGSMIASGLRMAISYGEKLCADIPEAKFGHMPSTGMNSALFNMGHLAIYPERILGMMGRQDLAVPLEAGWEDLFKNGAPCVEQDGRYPGKEAILKRFVQRHQAVADALASVSDDHFRAANPMGGRMAEMLPTVGAAVMFLCGSHLQMHLGQVSAWRRAMGMGKRHVRRTE